MKIANLTWAKSGQWCPVDATRVRGVVRPDPKTLETCPEAGAVVAIGNDRELDCTLVVREDVATARSLIAAAAAPDDRVGGQTR